MRKRIITLGVLLLIGLGMVACGSAEDSTVSNVTNSSETGGNVLKVWVPSEELAITRKMCDLFLEKYGYDSLTIECVEMSEESSLTSLTVDWSTSADIVQYYTADARYLVDAGLLLPIALNQEELK